MNAFELKIDSDCEDIIGLYTPVAVDLRFVLAMLKINTNLERIADFCEGMSRFVIDYPQISVDAELLDKTNLREMLDTIKKMMEKGRALAFQVSEELFQRVKEYLENYEKAYHRRLTQKEFVIGLIEQALEEAEEEFEAARAAEHEEQAENGWEAAETAETAEDEEVSDDEEAEDWDEENGETEGLSADEETAGSSWEPAENTETDEGEEGPSEDDEDTTPESWNRDEEEETEPDDDTIESGETNENEDETYA